MKNKGFTLIELLAVIVLLGIIGSIGVVSYQRFVVNTKTKVYETYERSMYDTAIIMLTEAYEKNDNTLIPTKTKPVKITVTDLYLKGGLDYIVNPNDKDDLCLNSYIYIEKLDKTTVTSSDGKEYYNDNLNLKYTVHLICNDYTETKVFE